MKIKKVLRLLDVVEKLPSDIRHMLYEEDTSMDMDGAYFSVETQCKVIVTLKKLKRNQTVPTLGQIEEPSTLSSEREGLSVNLDYVRKE